MRGKNCPFVNRNYPEFVTDPTKAGHPYRGSRLCLL